MQPNEQPKAVGTRFDLVFRSEEETVPGTSRARSTETKIFLYVNVGAVVSPFSDRR